MRIESISCTAEVDALLVASGLPAPDVGDRASLHLFGARVDGKLAGVVGIEVHGTVGLLRSLAVDAAFRKAGVGRALIAHAEAWAAQQRINELYLLTATAAGFFASLGYAELSRSEAPEAIAQTTLFASLCPASATLMGKRIAETG